MASKIDDFASQARAAGYTWDEIKTQVQSFRGAGADAGYTDDDINKFLGVADSAAQMPAMKSQAQAAIDALPKPEGSGVVMSYLDAFRQSSAGLLIFGHTKVDTPPPDGEAAHIASLIGGTVGDLPAMAVGAVAGAAVGAATTANPVGATLGGAMGGFGLPANIKAAYADGVKNGAYQSPWDYASRQAAIWHETARAAATGAAMVAGGEVAAPLGTIAKLGAEVGTVTVAAKALEGQLQDLKPEDFLDNAILLGGFKGVEAATKFAPMIRDNLLDHWVKTDEKPADALALARMDESVREPLTQPPPPAWAQQTPAPAPPGETAKPITITLYRGASGQAAHDAGYFWATDVATARDYAGNTGTVAQKTMTFTNPLVTPTWGAAKTALGLPRSTTMPEFIDAARAAGHDGVSFETKNGTEWINLAGKETSTASVTPDADGSGDLVIQKPPAPEPAPEPAPAVELPQATGKETSANPLAPDYAADPAAARAAVLSRVAPPEPGATFSEKISRVWMDVRKQYLDRDAPINDLEEKIAEGRPIDAAQSPKVLREITRVSGERSRLMVEKGMIDFEGDQSGPGLLDILKPFDKDPDGFWAYAVSRWATEKAGQGKETGVDPNAARVVAEAGRAQYGAAFDQLVEWQNGTLEYLKEAGVLSEEAFNRMTEENTARIPGYRAGKEGNGGGQGFNPVKEFKGSELPVKDILTSLIHDAFIRVELANRARYSTAVNDLGIEAGLAQETGRTQPIRFELGLDELERLGAEQVAEGDSAIWRHINKILAPDEALSVKDGKVTITKWADPEIPEILRGYDIPTLSVIGKMMAAFTRVQKALIVYDPTFAVRMKIYDIPQQFITNPGFSNPLFQFVEGFGHTLFRDATWRDAVNRGVVNDAFKHTTEDAYTRNILANRADPTFTASIRNGIENAAKMPLRALKYWSGLFHQASEVGNLAARDRKGGDPLRNAAEATQSSFPPPGRGGSQTRLINQIQPFFSAYISGLETTARSQLGIGQTTGGKPFSAAQFTMKALALVTMPVIASYLMNKDQDWYKNTPEWQKDNGLLFPPIEPGGSPIFLKFPPVISYLYGAMPRRIVAAIDQHDPEALTKGSWQSLAWSFAPPGGLIQYNIALPLIEKIANFSFHRGAPLNPAALSGPTGPQAPEKFFPYSTDLAKNIALGMNNNPLLRNFNMSPPEIDNFIHSWGGSIGPAIVTYAEKALGHHPEAPVDHWEDLPGASSFFARNTGASAVPVKDFVAKMDGIAAVHASLGVAMADGNLARFKELVAANPVAASMLPLSFGASARGLNAAGQASIEPQYLDAIRAAVGSINSAGIGELAQTQQTMGLLRTLASAVESVETPVTRGYVETLTGGTGVQGPLSAMDKRQLLDRIYGQMVVVGKQGNDQAAQLGVR